MLIQLSMTRLEDRLAMMQCCHGEHEILFCVCVVIVAAADLRRTVLAAAGWAFLILEGEALAMFDLARVGGGDESTLLKDDDDHLLPISRDVIEIERMTAWCL